jgi:hypothetical protein
MGDGYSAVEKIINKSVPYFIFVKLASQVYVCYFNTYLICITGELLNVPITVFV